MAFPMEKLVEALEATEEERPSSAFISAPMARAILGGSYPRLSPLLSSATRCARPMVDGWARLGVGGGGGGTRAGNNIIESTPMPKPGPPPGRVPHVADVRGPSGAPEVTRRTIPSVDRSSRLLRSFTLGTLKKGGNIKGGPPPRQPRSRKRQKAASCEAEDAQGGLHVLPFLSKTAGPAHVDRRHEDG